jgi:hypothetical protein
MGDATDRILFPTVDDARAEARRLIEQIDAGTDPRSASGPVRLGNQPAEVGAAAISRLDGAAAPPPVSGLSATALLAALRGVPPELPAGQSAVWVQGTGWQALELPPGLRPALQGRLLVFEGKMAVEQWEVWAAGVQARSAAETAAFLREFGFGEHPTRRVCRHKTKIADAGGQSANWVSVVRLFETESGVNSGRIWRIC